MSDSRFFSVKGPFKIRELARIGRASLHRDVNLDQLIYDVASLNSAGPDDVSFIDNQIYLEDFKRCNAGACVVHPDRVGLAPKSMSVLESKEPYLSYARIATAFYPSLDKSLDIERPLTSQIHPTAKIGKDLKISAGAIIMQNASIGNNVRIGPNAVVGPGVIIGNDCYLGATSSVFYCIMGNGVRLYAGARIGEAGFGFAKDRSGFQTVPQLGRVLIGDYVEIGANSTVDRGSGPDTVIGAGCRIDNLVQIGHNVRLGENCIIVALAGIAGSSELQNSVTVGGQVGIAGHLKIGEGVQIGAQSGVMRDIKSGERVGGTPAVPIRQFFRQAATLKKIMREKDKK